MTDHRIQKLLAIANDPAATPAEVATAKRLAERLSARTPTTRPDDIGIKFRIHVPIRVRYSVGPITTTWS